VAGFEKYMRSEKFCHMDYNKTVEEEAWQSFFNVLVLPDKK
jgi:hypothetical protein